MDRADVMKVVDEPISRRLLMSDVPARLAYTALDGDPRVVPIGFWWNGEELVICTAPAAAKVRALQQNPRVAITIDHLLPWPPRVLLIRGSARVELVEGVPEEYIEGSRKALPAEVFDDWETQVRGLYDRMVRIRITPDWAKLLDFETTLPKAVEDLIREKMARR
ncbi:MAG TPA: pyridoxamine 5'-phosphate oxidase family protein [Pseudonocardia sp.]|jgi:hypothetical protein|uniref:pyridoxamine 5'-phosphate oxidase family protein n=1 Tax=Pseudonocardia sp. TaxID=60912 RepID=UPI002B4B8419|nr:pyridoxamine 5'-phosphate oxidase family protein [Pseudonocardia sp.]HLU53893.1 pyridoxamine 5'-phosphate oxidase family protein [Pseudonocardia sp.]